MPLTGIVELSSLNERQRRHLTSNHLGRKGPPRPAQVMRRSRRACLCRGLAVGSNGCVVERADFIF